jgi:UPF0042 nucleotide-binding protein
MAKTRANAAQQPELVVITGISGSGKATVLRAFEDRGYYAVDHLPVDLLPKFAELTRKAEGIRRAAIVVDVREGDALSRFPDIFRRLQKRTRATLVFLEADNQVLLRRYSETRRPHPLGRESVLRSVTDERKRLKPIRAIADQIMDTSGLTVHQLRSLIEEKFGGAAAVSLSISVISFGFRNGLPSDADLVFDVRFLPNPNYIPDLRPKSGKHPAVARYMRGFEQTEEFIVRVTEMLTYLIPHYEAEGKRYLTIAFGCTGGHHRSVMIAEEVRGRLAKRGFATRGSHRDIRKEY